VLLRAYGFLGAIEAAVAMTAFFGFLFSQGWDWGQSLPWDTPLSRQATSVTLAAIVLAQVANVFACRSEQASIVAIGVTTNRLLLIGIVVELLLLLALVYTPLGQLIFGTASLPLWLWPLLVLGGLLVLVAEEMRKWVLRRRKTS
jgi:sodium/potassium-transporting ATPase subunit alpha